MALPVNLFAGIVEELTLKDVKYILIALGVALLVVIVIGGIGLVAESRWYLVTYGILMGLLAMANLGGGVYLLNQTDSIKKTVDTFMDDSFLDPSMTIFHEIESRFKCCGTFGPDFYLTYDGEDFVAPSCCEGGRYCSKFTAYQRGCSYVLRAGLEKESTNWGF
ncbi:unnamed protein product [Arctia plantaginis]|nr:unnamed protein product [Arctia plantaginis]